MDHLNDAILLDSHDYEENWMSVAWWKGQQRFREDLPDDAGLESRDAGWDLYYVARFGYHYRVRRWETNEEVRTQGS